MGKKQKVVKWQTVIHKMLNGYWVNTNGMYPAEIRAIKLALDGHMITDRPALKKLKEFGFMVLDD